jgi:CelD/BcsL family acetyltransferase involved in cellulose biosynthesis
MSLVTCTSGTAEEEKSLQVRVYETLADIESLRSHWDQLLSEFRGATTFSSWEWLAPWWRAFGQRRLLLVLAFFEESSQLVGLAPLSVERRKLTYLADLQVVRFWGDGSGDSDNLDFPVRAGFEDQAAAALLNYLANGPRRWDYCELNTMPEDSVVGNCLWRHLRHRAWVAYRHQQTGSAILLPETWEAYLVQLSAKERGKVAYRRRLLEKKYQTRFYKCENQTELGVCLDTLFRLHQKRWNIAGEPGSFISAERCQFYSEMAELLLRRGCLEFWLLDLDGIPVAAQFGFCLDRTFFSLQEGYDPFYSSDSVGYVLRAHVIRHLIAASVRRYDFLAGEAASKTRWDAGVTQYLNVHFARPASKGSLYLQTVNAASEGKEWLRRNSPERAWQALHWLNCTIRGIKMQPSSKE